MTNDKIIDAIFKINPNAECVVGGHSLDEIKWLDGTTPISKSDIEAKMAELKTEYDNNKYQRDRAVAYKQLKEQLDLLYHDMVADKGD